MTREFFKLLPTSRRKKIKYRHSILIVFTLLNRIFKTKNVPLNSAQREGTDPDVL